MKKVLSLVLVIAMVLSSMSFAFAGTFEDVTGDYEGAVEALSALGVINGYEDGTFRPEKTITRAELAKVLVEALGYGQLVAGANSNFSDTQNHWANGYVAIAAGTGLVVGYPDGTFAPDKAVTYDEALTMVVRALGYTDASLKGTWPTNYKVKAIDLDLTDDVVMAKAAADRGGVAQILFNALEVELVEIDEDGIVVGADKLLIDNIATPDTVTITKNSVDADHDDYLGDVVDLEQYMFESINVYLNDDDEVVYVKDSNSTVIEGTYDDMTIADAEGDVVVEIEEADEDVEEVAFVVDEDEFITVNVYENGAINDSKDYADLADTETIKAVYTDPSYSDDSYDEDDEVLAGFVLTTQTKAALVEDEYINGKAYVDAFDLPVEDDEVDFDNVVVKGAVDSVEDIEEDDVVVEYAAYDDGNLVKTTLVVTRETVEGKVTRVKDSNTFVIEGTSYDTSDLYAGDALVLGSEGVFFLDHNGDIVDFDGEDEGPTDYAIVLGFEDGDVATKFSKTSVDNNPQIKLATQDNEEVVYDLYVDLGTDGLVDESFELDGEEFFAKDVEYDSVDNADLVVEDAIADNTLVKYSVNEDGEIDEIEIVTVNHVNTLDLEKSTNELATDAVVFDAGDDYAVVDADALPTEIDGYIVRNSSGDIIVVVADADVISGAAEVVFVYIYDVDPAYNDSEKVQVAGVYTDDADSSIFTTDDTTITSFAEGVYAVKYDGADIDVATAIADYTLDGEVVTGVVTASAVNASRGLIEINDEWFAMSENATVVDMDLVDGEWVEDGLADLYEIDEDNTEFVAYINADGDIDLILILE